MRNSKIAIATKTILAIGILTLVFSIGTHAGQDTSELQPPVTTIATELGVKARTLEVPTVQYVEKPVPVTQYIERVQQVAIELRNFNDIEELTQWLKDRKNVTTVIFQSSNTIVDCDDYALELQHKALADGYIMSFEVIGESEYNALFKTPLPTSQSLHAINLAIIDNSVYYIEPQTDEVVLVAQLD